MSTDFISSPLPESTHLSALILAMGGIPVGTAAAAAISDNVITVGSLAYAQRAQAINDSGRMETGWTHLGSGISRNVFAGPDGNAYKVQQYVPGSITGAANQSEFKAYVELSPFLPESIKLAPCTVWTNSVQAMVNCGNDRIDTRSPAIRALISELTRISRVNGFGGGYGIGDLHAGNVRMINGVLFAIDYAM